MNIFFKMLLLNITAGGGRAIDAMLDNRVLLVDYVRVYRLGPCHPPAELLEYSPAG